MDTFKNKECLLECEDDLNKIEENLDISNENISLNKISRLPLARVKNIMKVDPDIKLASQDSVALVAKAAELFIAAFSKDIGKLVLKTKRKTILKKDVETIIGNTNQLCFLDGVLD